MVLAIERLPKRQRQQQLLQAIEANPFMTDEELMRTFKVSIQTVRLDRLELGIPELRERMKHMAVKTYDHVRSLAIDEVIGEVIDLQLDKSGISIFEIKEDHVFSRTKIARGHHIFSQANSLAVAVIDDPIALTASADIRFIRSVSWERNVSPKPMCVPPSPKRESKSRGVHLCRRRDRFPGKFVILFEVIKSRRRRLHDHRD